MIEEKMEKTDAKIPVILDTDIGGDIDDTWALAMLLKCPELDVKLITTCTGDTSFRAAIVARMLEIAGRTDIPIAIGIPLADPNWEDTPIQERWVEGYRLEDYPGKMIRDGVSEIIETIMNSPEPVTLVCIGPVPNISAALAREPRIAERARFVGMHGSIRRGMIGTDHPVPEYNVFRYVDACRKVFAAPWRDVTITPVDTCGQVQLTGEKYQKVYNCQDPLVRALIENYTVWCEHERVYRLDDIATQSSILFDTVAVYLAFSEELLGIEELGIQIADDGMTLVDEQAKKIRCATEWKNLEAFEDFLVGRLTGES